MGNFHKVMLTIASALIAASIATPAAATKTEEALALCRARGPDCHAMKISAEGSNSTTILCVNNSSTGNGVQCVNCPEGKDCSVARIVPVTKRGVGGVLNNDMRARRRTAR
jgi:hypothetical protein